jgi:hypothetical protein
MKKGSIAMLTAVVLVAPVTLASGQQVITKDQIAGTWKLRSFYDEGVETGRKLNVFGENPRGLLVLTTDGRIALVHLAASRAPPQDLPPTDAEASALFKTMLAYVGTYDIDPTPSEEGTKMILRAEVSSNPRIEGVDRSFFVKVSGNTLTFKTNPPVRNPSVGEMTTRNAILERDR